MERDNNSDDLYANEESQEINETNFVPTTDPFAIPAMESASSSYQSPSITNQSPSIPATHPPPQPIILPHQQFAEQPFPASSAYITNERDVNRVMLNLVHTLQADMAYLNNHRILFPHEVVLMESLEQILPASLSSNSTNNVAATPTPPPILEDNFAEHLMEWQINMSDVYAGIQEAVSADGDDDHDDMRLNVNGMNYEGLLELGERIGYVSSGATDAVIRDNMQHHKYGSSSFASANSLNESCCICQEEYTEGEDVSILNCRHSYHFECIKQWLVLNNSCPICRRTAPDLINIIS